MEDQSIMEARERLKARFSNTRTGGKGSIRRKKKATHKTASTDDKRLQQTLKRLGVTTIPGIEEVNLFKDDGNIVHFENPKVQAAVGSNTFVVSGNGQTKPMQDLLPDILTQLGPDSLGDLKKLASSVAPQGGAADDDDDDDVPDVEGNFDDADEEEEGKAD